MLADRQVALAADVADAIHARGGEALPVELDVRDADAFAEVAAEARARFGSVDYFFNNAGIAIGGEIADHDRGTWDAVLDVNVRGVAYGIDAVYPIMREQGSGHIINTGVHRGPARHRRGRRVHRVQARGRRDQQGPAGRGGAPRGARVGALPGSDPDPDPAGR